MKKCPKHSHKWYVGLALLGSAMGVIWIYKQKSPTIQRVSLVKQDKELSLWGHGFGHQQHNSYLLIQTSKRRITVQEALTWTDTHIKVRVPDTENSGSVRVKKQTPLGSWSSPAVPFVTQSDSLPSQPYSYELPVQEHAPWPLFRRDHRNTASTPIVAQYYKDQPWAFQTGKGIFSTPIIDHDGTIYVGSADHIFYAINPDGSEKWHFKTGEIIDSAAALPRPGTDNTATVIVPSGDGYLYCLRTKDGSKVWKFDARTSPRASYNNWFEGNVGIGFDGTLYAGNTNFNYYAITPDGKLKWTYPTGSNAWSIAGHLKDGTLIWTSNDTFIRAVSPDGTEKWSKRTLGFLAASAAIGTDDTVYVGSFDSYFYALDGNTGKLKWRYKTGDHIYASAALGERPAGKTAAIYFGSTDGICYALTPEGEELWTYDAGAPIRSSAVLGKAPDGSESVYFGCGNGKVYALNAHDGKRRWSFDTTPQDAENRARNDVNGSPALGKTGLYTGGEHGQLWYIPYDYCLNAEDDPRCCTNPNEDYAPDMAELAYVNPGGNIELQPPIELPLSTVLTLRLIVRQEGKTLDARLYNAPLGRTEEALSVKINPPTPIQVETSGDGRYLHLIPQTFLEPDTEYTLDISGNYYTGGIAIGNMKLGGREAGRFAQTFTFRTPGVKAKKLPLEIQDKQTTALEWTRLAVPIPTMLPSLNQIGFDYMNWIIGTITITEPDENQEGRCVLWAIGGQRDAEGVLVCDPDSDFMLPLSGSYKGDNFKLTNRNFLLKITGIPIPFKTFELRGMMDHNQQVGPDATAYAETEVLSIPTFGPYMVIAGLANNWWQKLLAMGTYITHPYRGPANRQPEGIWVDKLSYVAPTGGNEGKVTAEFTIEPGHRYPLSQHRPAILLVDMANTEALVIDYQNALASTADADGNLERLTLTIPADMQMPGDVEAVVILDVFPVYRQRVGSVL